MRAVFQLPARITSWAEAPSAVSSLASPTRPEWADSQPRLDAAGPGDRGEPLADGLRRQADDALGQGDVAAPFAQRPDVKGDVALDEAHVDRLAVGVRLAAADGDEQAVVASRVGHVPPLEAPRSQVAGVPLESAAREISRIAAAPGFPFDPDLLQHVSPIEWKNVILYGEFTNDLGYGWYPQQRVRLAALAAGFDGGW